MQYLDIVAKVNSVKFWVLNVKVQLNWLKEFKLELYEAEHVEI